MFFQYYSNPKIDHFLALWYQFLTAWLESKKVIPKRKQAIKNWMNKLSAPLQFFFAFQAVSILLLLKNANFGGTKNLNRSCLQNVSVQFLVDNNEPNKTIYCYYNNLRSTHAPYFSPSFFLYVAHQSAKMWDAIFLTSKNGRKTRQQRPAPPLLSRR